MAVQKVDIIKFLELAKTHPIFDVRSPGEYHKAHIPGAISLPLFSDEERKVVGTAYKQQSRELAIKIGLDYFGPKMRGVVETVEKILEQQQLAKEPTAEAASKIVLVHCWRGGMRSGAIAWLLDLYGFKVYSLAGGYKKFRNWIIEAFTYTYPLQILGGYTGSGKTYVIQALQQQNHHVIDLEGLAMHKGSAFGSIGLPPQPSQEMFENLLGLELHKIHQGEDLQPIWVEDESQRIGLVNIPPPLWISMRTSPVYYLDIPFEERLKHIVAEYGSLDQQRMLDAISRIQKRLGGLETKLAMQNLQEGDVAGAFRILLKYYDKWYEKGLQNRENLNELLKRIPCNKVDAIENMHLLLDKYDERIN